MKEIGSADRHEVGRRLNNRAENSHQPFRRRERAMQRFRSLKTLQKFSSVHAQVHNQFNQERHLVTRQDLQAETLCCIGGVAGACTVGSRLREDVSRHPQATAVALTSPLPAVLRDKQPGGLALHGRGDEDRARLGGALDSRGDIGRAAEHFARCVDHHQPGIEADPRGKFRRDFAGVSGVDCDKRALDRERRAHSALGVILLRVRIAEQRHQTIAELFQYMAAKPDHRRRSLVE